MTEPLKPCPICLKPGRLFYKTVYCSDDTGACTLNAHTSLPLDVWQALPRVVEDAESLVDEFADASDMLLLSEHDGAKDTSYLARRFDNAKSAVLRAMVVPPPITAEQVWDELAGYEDSREPAVTLHNVKMQDVVGAFARLRDMPSPGPGAFRDLLISIARGGK